MDKANGDSHPANPEAEFAKAWTELAKGERTATALENHLDALEAKIDELLKHAERTGDQDNWKEESNSDSGESSKHAGDEKAEDAQKEHSREVEDEMKEQEKP